MHPNATALVLGIETSCDETAAAVVDGGREVLSNVVASQIPFHRCFGGVVPEIASRRHLESINPVIEEALGRAEVALEQLSAIGVTVGPGLEGSLLVGVSAAKGMCLALEKPLIPVNHIEAHICANFLLGDPPEVPFVCLVASGGHSDIILVRENLAYELLGATRDDAAGEALDKVGRVMGLPYPAGKEIDALAQRGDRAALHFPRTDFPDSHDFSFSGVKTAAARYIAKLTEGELEAQRADICAGFQEAIMEVLVEHTLEAARKHSIKAICMGGGVAANSRLRSLFHERCRAEGIALHFPPQELCLDNAAMVAAAAYRRLKAGRIGTLEADVSSTLPLG